MDINGKIIIQGILEGQNSRQIDFTMLKSAVYFLRVNTLVKKLIKY